ncbi:uncharacterized protein LOC135463703 [Liolophura sinensis]|uniref:uncharacterized protein LOC135463703 n=1 Tax=Liolophura sinensis TaxID=3198878 RepID=UPI003158375D
MSTGLHIFTFIACFSQLGAFLTCQGPCIEVPDYPGAGNGSCMFITKERHNWSTSNSLCASYGALPVVIPDSRTNGLIHTALRRLSPVERPWIGGNVTSHPWAWVTESPFYNQTGCCSGLLNASVHRIPEVTPSLCVTSCRSHQYQYAYVKGDICGCSNITCTDPGSSTCQMICDGNWSAFCPTDWNTSVVGYDVNDRVQLSDISDMSNACGVLLVQDGRWIIQAHSCREQLRFLCENDFEGSLSPSTNLLSFFDARMSCLDRESDLFVMADNQSNLTQLDDGSYWIGLTRFSVMWYPGETVLFYSLRDFDSHYIGGCFFVSPMAIRGQWFVDNCTRHRHALCIQVPHVQVTPDPDSVPKNDSIVSTPAQGPVAWCLGEEACQAEGGHLVVIPDQHIESHVFKEVHGDVWIGGRIYRQPWTTVTDRRLYKYSGCCFFVHTDESKMFQTDPNCAAICVPMCGQHGFLYAYLKSDKCACSNKTCSEDYIGVCPDKCPNLEKLEETCGNYQEDFYTVYETIELDLPPWKLEDLQTVHHCAALEIQRSAARMRSWGCGKKFKYLCSTNSTDSDYITIHEEEVSWLKARQHCVEKGGDLAMVGQYSPLLNNLTDGLYWIGVSQFKLTWHTGETMVYNGLDSFDDSYIPGCVKLSPLPPYWNVEFCDQDLKPLCFKAPPQTTTPSPQDTSSSPAHTQTPTGLPQETSPNTDAPTSHFTEKTTSSSPDVSSVPTTTSLPSDCQVKLIIGCTVPVVLMVVFGTLLVYCVFKKRNNYVIRHDMKDLSSPILNGNSATTLNTAL